MQPHHPKPRSPTRPKDRARGNLLLGAAVLAFAGYVFAQNPPAPNSVTEEQAKVIALKKVPGKVTDVAIEKKRGKHVYVVEIQTEKKGEKDVFVDMQSGAIVGTD
ncbi:MAG: PepSY domain-containing protein [Pseudomonadota bacterium]